ncbi:MAG: rod shape-determining protein MreC [Vulcanimicrobiaceae bacterium]
MVPIATYRDERKLLAVIGGTIGLALIALVQLGALRAGGTSPLSAGASATLGIAETALTDLGNRATALASSVAEWPALAAHNRALVARNHTLARENARLFAALAQSRGEDALAREAARVPGAIAAGIVGYDPENLERTVTLDRGTLAGIARDDGVIDAGGAVVGRVIAASALESTVLLATDGSSKIPAIVRRGRWWAIAVGTSTRIRLQYVSQDAALRVGDRVVTGAGRSFPAGYPIGTIVRVERQVGALYQGALLEPAVAFGRLERVLVLR